jgi:hypothetical protein
VDIDGLLLNEIISVQLWPTLGKLQNSTSSFLTDASSGSGKPTNIERFLWKFVNVSTLFAENGLTIKKPQVSG